MTSAANERGQKQHRVRMMGEKGIPHRLLVWATWNSYDWPTGRG